MQIYCTLTFFVVAIVCYTFSSAYGDQECDVCIKVLEKIKDEIVANGLDPLNKDVIESAVDNFCEKVSIHPREQKVCYYLSPIKKKISQPFSLGLPMDKVCKRLQADNTEICAVKYPAEITKDVDFSKMRVKRLKQLLSDVGQDCVGCLEKSDYIDMVKKVYLNQEL